MKRIYLDAVGKIHSLYKEWVNYPPIGYEYSVSNTSLTSNILKNRNIFSFQQYYLAQLLPLTMCKAYMDRFKNIPPDVDLTLSAGHLVFRKEPWIVNLETVTELAGYYVGHFNRNKKLVEKIISSECCKRIICWSDAGRKTVIDNLDIPKIEDKVVTVYLAVHENKFVKTYCENKVKFLFVGSSNIPGSFELKGGKEVIDAFIRLSQKYSNLDLVIRSDVPKYLKEKCSRIRNLTIIDKTISRASLEDEFKSSDIFLFPSHITPGMAILEALSYGLPVITTDVWANPELIEDGITGFIVGRSKSLECYYRDAYITNWISPNLIKSSRYSSDDVVEQIVAKASILIENPELRRRMGNAGRFNISNGKFSITRRNKALKTIFDQATN